MSVARTSLPSPRDFSSMCPYIHPHPWRSVRRRQRRMHELRRHQFSATCPSSFRVTDPTDAIFMVSSNWSPPNVPTTNPLSTVDCATQTDVRPLPSYSSTSTQTRPESTRISIATQTSPSSRITSSVAVQVSSPNKASPCPSEPITPPSPPSEDQDELYRINPVPSDDIWRSSPEQFFWSHTDPCTLLDPPLPPIPPLPRPPKEYVTYKVDDNWGHQVNLQKPPAAPPPRASYSLAETTADVLSFVSQHYPSILHAQYDYFRLPPFQRRAILDLHRLLYPYGLRKWRSASAFGLLPMRFIMSYIYTWEGVMSAVVQDSGEELDYQFVQGVFIR